MSRHVSVTTFQGGMILIGTLIASAVATYGLLRLYQKSEPSDPIIRLLGQNAEDLAGGTWITGFQGSGKSYYIFWLMHNLTKMGVGGCFASVKGANMEVIGRLPTDKVDLIRPHSDRPVGLNILQTYRGTKEEIEVLSKLVSEWFAIENATNGHKMQALLEGGTYGLLEYSVRNKRQASLIDLYRFFHNPDFRATVLEFSDPTVKSLFAEPKEIKDSLSRVALQVSGVLRSSSLRTALGQEQGINLMQAMRQNRWVILDAPANRVPHSPFLCRALASLVQMLTGNRRKLEHGSLPWMAIFDEIQEYPTDVFAKGIVMARQYGVCWVLAHHSREGQLTSPALHASVGLCANKVFFRQSPDDSDHCSKAVAGNFKPEQFILLPKRHYLAVRRINGGDVQLAEGVTPDVPRPDPAQARAILRLNRQGRKRHEVLSDLTKQLEG